MKQSELIKQITDKDLKKSLYMSQFLLLGLALVLSIFLFDNMTNWTIQFRLDAKDIFYIGVLSGLIIVCIDLLLMLIFPKRFYDDGGINERIFASLNLKEIFIICIVIAVSEELLFRGVLQTSFGYIPASIIFALVHVRYLLKPVLLVSVLMISFFIGYLFILTGNLYVTIATHFTVDFLLGVIIHFKKRGVNNEYRDR